MYVSFQRVIVPNQQAADERLAVNLNDNSEGSKQRL